MTKNVFFSLFFIFLSFFDTNPTRNRPKIAQIRDFLPDPGISLRIWSDPGISGISWEIRDFLGNLGFPGISGIARKSVVVRISVGCSVYGVVLLVVGVTDSIPKNRMWELSCDYRT